MVAQSGDLGVTWGAYYFESVDELGAPFISEGKYVFVWRMIDGEWKLVLDISNESDFLLEGERIELLADPMQEEAVEYSEGF